MQLDQHLAAIGQLDFELQPHRILRLIVDCVPNAVRDIALVVGGVERQPRRNLLGQWPAQRPFRLDGAEITAGHLQVSLRGVRRSLAHILNEAARGVAPEQRALRTAQHFDPLQIEQ